MSHINDSYVRDLDLNLLRVFAVVAETGSITQAAARLYLTQPAVSAAMARLAAFVGAALVTRQGRGIVLTTRGLTLLSAARAHLQPLVAATIAAPVFAAAASTAVVRLGLADGMESLLLPKLLARLEREAPGIQLVILPVQFRTVEDAILAHKVDVAVSVADDLPRSILRQPLALAAHAANTFVCLYDSRSGHLPRRLTEKAYFAREHVVVSYAGDVRGIVEDALGKTRKVRVSVPAFSYVADVVDGTRLVATLPRLQAAHIIATRPHLRTAALPFSFAATSLDLLWSRHTDEDPESRFVRSLIVSAAHSLGARPQSGARAKVLRQRRTARIPV